ncbi:hypothetical protein [Jeotgalibaca porci]|uniref:hypothetical protein n=1 Tax=Jeotgalibaca porci TaxID=1868793 RepID=UPI0035A18BE1
MKLPEWANWLVRDRDGELYAFEIKPIKATENGEWFEFGCGRLKEVEETDDTFETVKWTDEEPTVVDKDRNTFKWLEKPALLPTRETLNEVFGSKSDEKPTEVKTTTLREWVKWLARDENNELWCYATKPYKESDRWHSEDPTGRCEKVDDVSEIYNLIQWTDKEPTEVISGRGTLGISVAELNRIVSAKAHGYDSVPEMVERPKEGGKTMSEKPKYFIGQPVIETYRGAEGVYLGNGPREDDESTAFVRLESGEILITSPEYVKRTNTFTCSQVMAGLEQHYFKEGTRFRVNAETIFEVVLTGSDKLGLRRDDVSGMACINLYCSYIHATWTLIYEGPKEMTLSEIEEALGHRVKIKEGR